jgi:hypothetical protein
MGPGLVGRIVYLYVHILLEPRAVVLNQATGVCCEVIGERGGTFCSRNQTSR